MKSIELRKLVSSRALGGILLIMGTSLGGGVLALPITNSSYGFGYSTLYLVGIWLLMTYCALLVVQVNALLPPGSHFMSMARHCLGPFGEWLTLLIYLAMLYALLAAYSSGGGEMVLGALRGVGYSIDGAASSLAFVVVFGTIVFCGIRWLDYTNRLLMLLKGTTFFLLLLMLFPEVNFRNLQQGTLSLQGHANMIMITSFGYAIVIPPLRQYLEDDIALLKRVVMIGSCLPLIIYVIWHGVIYGAIDIQDMASLQLQEHPNLALSQLLLQRFGTPYVQLAFQMFAALCLLTSFMGVSLSLSSFIKDALRFEQAKIVQGPLSFILTFVPPLLLVFYFPSAFILALSYAGCCCWLLHVSFPLWLAYASRKKGSIVSNRCAPTVFAVALIASLILLWFF